MILTFRPIKIWPEGWDRHKGWGSESPFSASYSSTLELLDRELWALHAKEAILQVDAKESECRLDGQLRANASVGYRGVIISFEAKAGHIGDKDLGTLTYACNKFGSKSGQPGWQANLRAIALGLEALRKVERYGIGDRGQQYAGYAELPSGIALGSVMTNEDAAKFLHAAAEPDSLEVPWEQILDDPELAKLAFKTAAKRLHPDAGGDPALFRKLTDARDLLAR